MAKIKGPATKKGQQKRVFFKALFEEIFCAFHITFYVRREGFIVLEKMFCTCFGKDIVYFRNYFVHFFWETISAFEETFCISVNMWCIIKESYFVFQKTVWCNSRNILSIIKERLYAFQTIFCAFFKERF